MSIYLDLFFITLICMGYTTVRHYYGVYPKNIHMYNKMLYCLSLIMKVLIASCSNTKVASNMFHTEA